MSRMMLAASTALSISMLAGGVHAAAAAAEAGGGVLEEIVVTAQRRTENLQNVPIAITALTANALTNKGIQTSDDLTQAVPGLLWTRSTNFNQPAIRGVGTRDASSGNEPNIAIYIDGVYQPESITAMQDLGAVDRIEVLKGPQGTLYGRNATGGAISVVTADPSFTPKGSGSATYGRFGYYKFKALVSGPIISDKLAASLSYVNYGDNGYVHNNYLNITQGSASGQVVRPKVLFEPNDKIKINLNGLYSHGATNVLTSYYVLNSTVQNPATVNNLVLNPNRIPVGETLVASQPYHTATAIVPDAKVTQYQGDAHVSVDMGFATLTALAANGFIRAYNSSQTDASALYTSRTLYYPKTNFYDEEVNLTSNPGGKLTWLVGAQGFQGHSDFSPLLSGGRSTTTGALVLSNTAYGQFTRSWAVYGEATWNPVEKLFLTAGGRYSYDKKSAYNALNGVAKTMSSAHSDNFSPRGVIRYQFAEDSNVYASVTRGYKAGAYNAVSLTNGNLIYASPELITAYEVGYKADINHVVRLNASAYHYDYTNLQVSSALTVIINGIPNSFTNIQNAGKVSINGAEGGAEFVVNEHLDLNAGVSFIHTKISDLPNATLVVPNVAGTTPNTTTFGNKNITASVNGNQLIRAPKATFNVGGTYKTPIGGGDLTLTANAFFSAKYFAELGNRVSQPAYEIVNASATYRFSGGHYYVTVFGENLTNQVYAQGFFVSTTGDAAQAAKPRWAGVTIGADF